MMDGKRILALIPARGGSKGIPGKNIRMMAGKPLIAYTIGAALRCEEIDRVVVSTDSREIADVAVQYGAEVPCLRPEKLSGDTAKTIDAVLHMLRFLEEKKEFYDYLVLLQPTSPLRTEKEISEAIKLAYRSGRDVAAVSPVQDSPILIRSMGESGELFPLLETDSTVRRQDMPKYYRVNGSIYVNRVANLSGMTSLNDNPLGYCMEQRHSVDIDEEIDFMAAEYWLNREN